MRKNQWQPDNSPGLTDRQKRIINKRIIKKVETKMRLMNNCAICNTKFIQRGTGRYCRMCR